MDSRVFSFYYQMGNEENAAMASAIDAWAKRVDMKCVPVEFDKSDLNAFEARNTYLNQNTLYYFDIMQPKSCDHIKVSSKYVPGTPGCLT